MSSLKQPFQKTTIPRLDKVTAGYINMLRDLPATDHWHQKPTRRKSMETQVEGLKGLAQHLTTALEGKGVRIQSKSYPYIVKQVQDAVLSKWRDPGAYDDAFAMIDAALKYDKITSESVVTFVADFLNKKRLQPGAESSRGKALRLLMEAFAKEPVKNAESVIKTISYYAVRDQSTSIRTQCWQHMQAIIGHPQSCSYASAIHESCERIFSAVGGERAPALNRG